MFAGTPFVDGLEIQTSEEHAPRILKLVSAHVAMAPPIVGGPEAGDALDQSQVILDRVSSAVATLVEHTSERQKALDATRDTLAEEAEKKLKAARKIMDDQVNAIKGEYTAKAAALAEREDSLDDRANTHVRREFAKEMAALSDTRLSSNLLTKSRSSYLIPIGIALGAAFIVAAFAVSELSFVTGFNSNVAAVVNDSMIAADKKAALIQNLNSQIMYAQIRLAVQSLGIAALVWFALRMASSRYSVVSNWERELHKFRLDTERAGFLVEGDLEARKVNDHGLPDVLLESFSRNLFAGTERHSADAGSEGVGDALTALLGQATKVRAGPDGVSVEVDRRGIRRAKRTIGDED